MRRAFLCGQFRAALPLLGYDTSNAQTLDALATIATELGEPDDAAQLQAQASKMRAAMLARMVDHGTNLFLDGVFATPSSPSCERAVSILASVHHY